MRPSAQKHPNITKYKNKLKVIARVLWDFIIFLSSLCLLLCSLIVAALMFLSCSRYIHYVINLPFFLLVQSMISCHPSDGVIKSVTFSRARAKRSRTNEKKKLSGSFIQGTKQKRNGDVCRILSRNFSWYIYVCMMMLRIWYKQASILLRDSSKRYININVTNYQWRQFLWLWADAADS